MKLEPWYTVFSIVFKGLFTQKWEFCHYLLTLMLFQPSKTFIIHFRNTIEDLSDEIWEISVPQLRNYHFDNWKSSWRDCKTSVEWFSPNSLKRHNRFITMNKFNLGFLHKHSSTHTSVVVNVSSSRLCLLDMREPKRFILVLRSMFELL